MEGLPSAGCLTHRHTSDVAGHGPSLQESELQFAGGAVVSSVLEEHLRGGQTRSALACYRVRREWSVAAPAHWALGFLL